MACTSHWGKSMLRHRGWRCIGHGGSVKLQLGECYMRGKKEEENLSKRPPPKEVSSLLTSVHFARPNPIVDPEVLQSGFGLNFVFWSGEWSENSPQISQRIRQRIFVASFRPCFSRASGALKKFSPKIHTQNCRNSLLSDLVNQKVFSLRFFA